MAIDDAVIESLQAGMDVSGIYRAAELQIGESARVTAEGAFQDLIGIVEKITDERVRLTLIGAIRCKINLSRYDVVRA